jgi:4-amino-4-deoxy-L-arabinose transferase-like glycosyltransferase
MSARHMLRRIPRAAWIAGVIAFLNAACWSIVTPPFQVPDESSHFAYTQQLAENDQLPTSGASDYSPEERVVLKDLHHHEVRSSPENHTISSSIEQLRLHEDLERHLSRHGDGGVGGSYSGPPLYYLLEAVPYGVGSGGTLLDQLALMRLLSALMAGLATVFVFLFVRETLPAVPWAWTVGGLTVALTPLLAYISGAVNPDSMLAAVSAAIFYCLARAFRRGLTRTLAVAIGALTAVGFLTKLSFIGLAPGVILGLIVLTVRAARTSGGRAAGRSLGIALAIAASPLCVYILANLVSGHPVLGIVSSTLKLGGWGRSIFDEISYIWQFYLPRLPGMINPFPGLSTTRQLWFDRSVGYYGWLDTSFPVWVDNVALVPAGLIAFLCVRALVTIRTALRQRLVELVVYGVIGVGVMALIGASAYYGNNSNGASTTFAEPRYLLPMLPLLGAALALAARGAGRRFGPPVGALIVVLFLTHDILSQLLVVSRFYG